MVLRADGHYAFGAHSCNVCAIYIYNSTINLVPGHSLGFFQGFVDSLRDIYNIYDHAFSHTRVSRFGNTDNIWRHRTTIHMANNTTHGHSTYIDADAITRHFLHTHQYTACDWFGAILTNSMLSAASQSSASHCCAQRPELDIFCAL